MNRQERRRAAPARKPKSGAGAALGWLFVGILTLALGGFLGWAFFIFMDGYSTVQAFAHTSTPTLSPSPSATGTATPAKAQPTLTPLPPPTATRRIQPSLSPTASHTPIPIPTRYVSPTPPPNSKIEGFVGDKQALPLSCEASAATDWAAFFGIQIDELAFQSQLPVSDNPQSGFVGDVEGNWGRVPPEPYGIHPEPVAHLLRVYGASAWAMHNMSWESLKSEIYAGHPVIVWVVGHVARGTPVAYTASDGSEITVARYEHTVVVTGFDDHQVWIADGKDVYTRSIERFLESWGVLENLAIIWRD